MRRPELCKLELTRGNWILVKKFLTAGETRRIFRLMMRRGARGDEIDPVLVGLAKMIVFLVDWNLTDPDGEPLHIRGESDETILAVLDNLDADISAEVLEAVEGHEREMDAIREAEKKTSIIAPLSDPISPLPAPLGGGTSG
jgi:hypothetical protein